MEKVKDLEARIIALERAVEVLIERIPPTYCREVDPTGEWY